jgi:DNA-binding NtrC family response regulator
MATSKHVVLLVDDEPVSLMMLRHALQDKFNVRTASSGQQALEILGRETVSLLITDQRMPEMSGTQLLQQSRALCPDLVCIVLTGETNVDVLINAIAESGALRVLHKPWKPEEIVKSIEAALEYYESARRRKQVMEQLAQANRTLGQIVNGQ